MHTEFAAVRGEMATQWGQMQAAMVTQTRWMVTLVAFLGGLFTTVNVLLG